MIHGPVQVALSPAEWRLVCALREVPEGNLKKHVDRLLEELVHFLRDPHCASQQADGVPCVTPEADCDECAKLTEMVDSLAVANLRSEP